MAAYTVQTATRNGVEPTENAVAASDTFVNDGRTILVVDNGSGSELTVTITTPGTVDGLAIADKTVTVAIGDKAVIGPFPPAIYNNSDGVVTVAFNETTSVTAMCIRVE